MTREELKRHCLNQIESCEKWARLSGQEPYGKIYEEHKLILELLEQQSCDDAISRQDALRAFMYATNGERLPDYNCDNYPVTYDLRYIKKTLRALPPVTPQPKTGHWIIKDSKEQGYDIGGVKTWYIQIKCSECGFIKTAIEGHTGQYHYCPNCGAKMQETEG